MTKEKVSVGAHIRTLRRLQEKTLQNVADTCGFTKSLLSKIESGKIIPPVGTLVKIAKALNTTISALLAEGNGNECVFTSADDVHNALVKTENGDGIMPLAVEFKLKAMQPFIYFVKREDIGNKVFSHNGQEFMYIIEGKMQFQVGNKTYLMNSGDSIYFSATNDHRIVAVLTRNIRYIAVYS